MTTVSVHTDHWFEGMNERYDFDFRRCTVKDGWAQIDTDQDASYFGQWANPDQLRVVAFVEGDISDTKANSPEDFAAFIREMAEWSVEHDHGFAIDGMCNKHIIKRFEALGLGEFLH